MPLSSDALGTRYGPLERVVSARRLLAYAAGIGETSPWCLDDARPGGLVGFPAYCVSLEWPVLISPPSSPLGASRAEALRGVHASQDSVFHRPIRPGDRLITTGQVVELRSTRAGAFALTKLETRDAAGAPVVTTWSGSLFRGVPLDGASSALEVAPPPPGPTFDETKACAVPIPLGREAPHVYTECAEVWNPIHTERQVALAAGLPDIILHGTATWALAAREIVRQYAAGDPTRLRRLCGRFAAMVIAGEGIAVEMGAPQMGAVAFRVRNAQGELALADGVAELAF